MLLAVHFLDTVPCILNNSQYKPSGHTNCVLATICDWYPDRVDCFSLTVTLPALCLQCSEPPVSLPLAQRGDGDAPNLCLKVLGWPHTSALPPDGLQTGRTAAGCGHRGVLSTPLPRWWIPLWWTRGGASTCVLSWDWGHGGEHPLWWWRILDLWRSLWALMIYTPTMCRVWLILWLDIENVMYWHTLYMLPLALCHRIL